MLFLRFLRLGKQVLFPVGRAFRFGFKNLRFLFSFHLKITNKKSIKKIKQNKISRIVLILNETTIENIKIEYKLTN